MNNLVETLDASEPPKELAPPLKALWWLKKGGLKCGPEWELAHEICQTAEGTPDYDRIHALSHWIEGDVSNAQYWYRRSGHAQATQTIADEWAHILDALTAEP